MGLFDFVKKTYNDATKGQQPQQQGQQYQQAPNQSYVRQYLNVPSYDSKTLGIDVTGEIEYIKNIFRGRRLDTKGKKFIPFDGAHIIMNEAGAEALLSFHAFILSISNATTNFRDHNHIRGLCEEYGGNILESLCTNYKVWEVDKSFFDYIIDTLCNHFEMFLLKSMNDGQRKYMHGMTEQPQQNPMMPQFTM